MTFRWFNLSPHGILWRGYLIKPWNAFNRWFDPHWATQMNEPAHQWGFGLLQIGRRHLIYIGHDSAYLLFVCLIGGRS